ncbi:fatty acid desaturase family protein [Flavisolibacter nicotianae]|uniref:fatty acid desaturase family protein n=1 Tax=Flavisolibacter nicotianae TaxID=2364882 RepID=UPI000EADA948|nr:fatty acid desaturase [Flavisolibacter nicotianae]
MTITITDPTYHPNDRTSLFDDFILRFINDKRDLPFIYLTLKITFTVVPFALVLFFAQGIHWLFYLAYTGLYIFFLGPYILMLHNTCHRKLFKKQYSFLTKYIHWFLGLFFGETPETYFHHHIAMHHAENNLEEDLSSTMKYRRDSIRSFLHYLLQFYFFGVLHLSFYFSKKNRHKFAWRVLTGETIYILLMVALCFYNLTATLVVFIGPLLFTRFSMMAGNWAQHAFIDKAQPDNIYTNSITCINTVYNKKCFNDGYHIGHHLRSAMHWTEMPADFLKNIDKYRANRAVVFSGLDYFQIWFLLMTKNYGYLAKKFVSLDGELQNSVEIQAFLSSRTRRIMMK